MKKSKKMTSLLLFSVMVIYLYFHDADNYIEQKGNTTFSPIEIQQILFNPVHNVSCQLKSARLKCYNGNLDLKDRESIQNQTKTCPILRERKVMKKISKLYVLI